MAISIKQAIQSYRLERSVKKWNKAHIAHIRELIEKINSQRPNFVKIKILTKWNIIECDDPIGLVLSDGEMYLYIPPVYEHQPVHYFPVKKVRDIQMA